MKRFRDLRENVLDVPTHSPETLAKKHGVSVSHIHAELKKGIGVEHEHTSDSKIAREIALDHLGEKPDYYSKLDKAKLEEGLSHKVPVYHADRKTLAGYVSSGATSIGAAKLAKKKSASFERVNGKFGWVASSDLKESAEMTERERISHGERMKPEEKPPMDQAGKQKQALVQRDRTNDTVQNRFSQGGNDAGSHQALKSLKEGSNLPFHKYTNDELDAAIKHHADSATELRRFDRKSHAAYQHIQHAHAAREILKSRKRNNVMDEAYDMAFNESGSEGYKVGDKVIPKIGPHKGTVHSVIHVHPTGHLNIKPDVHVRSNRYHLGAAKADPKDVTRHLGEGFKSYLGYPNAENSHAEGTSFHQAIDHAHEHGNRVVYGTNSRKWHSITPLDRDWHTALDPGEAKRQGEAKSLLHSTAARRVEESMLLAGREEKPLHPNDATKQKVKAAKAWGPTGSWGTKGMDFHFPQSKLRGVNSKTVQEAFQAAKDKKNGKQDNLPQSQEGANEPGKEKIAAAEPQPQALGGDAPKTQDGGQPGAQQKKDNAPKPEASKNAKKLVPKGGEQFQADPFVTPLTTMPDTAAPKSGSQGVR